ncbi:protein takeout-like [Bacillus rossius redtenbacheri]|uniref:protein takeout-like n=1 Tax=Bacillus rossius redtenbacheri TaxID=93214 RepID=UPI002FDE3688
MGHRELVVSSLLAWLVAGSSVVAVDHLPSFVKICRRSDPKLSECVKDSVENLRPYLAAGIPELRIPPCEPLVIPQVELNQGKGPVNVRSTYSNIKVWGPTNFQLKTVKLDLQHNRVRMRVFLPHLYFTSDYEMSGRVLLLPIAGRGRCHSNYTDVEAACDMSGRMNKHADGKTYYQVTDLRFRLDIGNASMHLSDLFNGDQMLGDAMNTFLNENWKTVAMEIRPLIEETIAATIKDMSNRIYSSTSMDVLMPE